MVDEGTPAGSHLPAPRPPPHHLDPHLIPTCQWYRKPIRNLKFNPVSNPFVIVIPKRSKIRSNPVILIRGSLTGIGRATALAFAKIGARLVVSGRRPAEGKALEVELQRLGAEAVFIGADVRHDDEAAALIDQA